MPGQSLEASITDVIAQAVAQVANLIKADLIAQLQPTAPSSTARVASRRQPRQLAAPKKKPGRPAQPTPGLDNAVAQVFQAIQKRPGLRTEEAYKLLPLAPDVIKKALARLRETKRVKVKGIKRAAAYTAK
jgi:hypothetical protein